jgi:hypothetical protein
LFVDNPARSEYQDEDEGKFFLIILKKVWFCKQSVVYAFESSGTKQNSPLWKQFDGM